MGPVVPVSPEAPVAPIGPVVPCNPEAPVAPMGPVMVEVKFVTLTLVIDGLDGRVIFIMS
jgi:hypothetical protein